MIICTDISGGGLNSLLRKKRVVFFVLILFCLTSIPGMVATGLAQAPGNADWEYDILLLEKELSVLHPDFFRYRPRQAFSSEMHKLAKLSDRYSDFELAVKLQQILVRQGDPNTKINYHFWIKSDLILPLRFYWFEDGIYVTDAARSHQSLLGKKLVEINDHELSQVIDSLSTLIVVNNPSSLKAQVPSMLSWFQVLAFMGFTEDSTLTLTCMGSNNVRYASEISFPVKEEEMVRLQTAHTPLGWSHQNRFFWDTLIGNGDICYVQYNKCWSREVESREGSGGKALFMPSFRTFEKSLLKTLRNKDIKRLIVDLRFNDGGNIEQGEQLINQLHKNRFRKRMQFFLLTGRKTSGAAMINAVYFKEQLNPLVLGEKTAEKPDHFGQIKRFILPETKLVVNYSTRYYQIQDQDTNSLVPDVLTPMYFNDYMEGTDPPVSWILDH